MTKFGLDLAVIGNGHTAALLEPASRLVWWCFPRLDSDPVFSRLLAGDEEKGFCDVVLEDMVDYASDYERNTAIVSTVLTNSQGAQVKITDFAPRFQNFGRMFRPPQLIRIIEPVAGLPRIAIRVRPTSNYGKPIEDRSLGSNHITFRGKDLALRLTTDGPLAYIEREELVSTDQADPHGARPRRIVRRGHRHDLPRVRRAHPRLLAGVGPPPVDRL